MIRIYTDGAARGNPGRAAVAFVLDIPVTNRAWVEFNGLLEGSKTVNEAEYLAVREAVDYAARHSFDDITIVSDSKLVICQLVGRWKVKEPRLAVLREEIRRIISEGRLDVDFQWMPRETPGLMRADELCNTALDCGARLIRDVEQETVDVTITMMGQDGHPVSATTNMGKKVAAEKFSAFLNDDVEFTMAVKRRTVKNV